MECIPVLIEFGTGQFIVREGAGEDGMFPGNGIESQVVYEVLGFHDHHDSGFGHVQVIGEFSVVQIDGIHGHHAGLTVTAVEGHQ